MVNYLELPIGERAPEVIEAVIEIPYEGINKYEYDKKLHVFRLDRNLYSPVHYPGDYGFIPSTFSNDGDPLDVLRGLRPGTLMVIRRTVLYRISPTGLAQRICSTAYDTVHITM